MEASTASELVERWMSTLGPKRRDVEAEMRAGSRSYGAVTKLLRLAELPQGKDSPAREAAQELLEGKISSAVTKMADLGDSSDPLIAGQAMLASVSLLNTETLSPGDQTRLLATATAAVHGPDLTKASYAPTLLAALDSPDGKATIREVATGSKPQLAEAAAEVASRAGVLTESESSAVAQVYGDFFDRHYNLVDTCKAVLFELSQRAKQRTSDATWSTTSEAVEAMGTPVLQSGGLRELATDPGALVIFRGILNHKDPVLADLLESAVTVGDDSFLQDVDSGQLASSDWVLNELVSKMDERGELQRLKPPADFVRSSLARLLEQRQIATNSIVGAVVRSSNGSISLMTEALTKLDAPEARPALESALINAWDPQARSSMARALQSMELGNESNDPSLNTSLGR